MRFFDPIKDRPPTGIQATSGQKWYRIWIVAGTMLAAIVGIGQAQSLPENSVIGAIRVEVIDFPDPKSAIGQLARTLIVLQPGERFSEMLLDKSIRALMDSGRFDAIEVDSREVEGRLVLLFQLTPHPLVRRIRFRNIAPISEDRVARAMAVSVGDVFQTKRLPQIRDAVARLYQDAGFIAPTVAIRSEIDPADGNHTLIVDAEPGPSYKLAALNFNGNDAISDARLMRQVSARRAWFGLGPAPRFVERVLRRDINALVRHYRRNGYAQVTVRREVHKDAEAGSVSVDIHIDEGPLYQVEFRGNHGFSERVLKEDLVFGTEGNIRGRGERRSLENIRIRYRNAGYLEAEVNLESELRKPEGRAHRTVRFVLVEGPRTVVGNVSVEGNRSLTEAQIYANILTRPPRWRFHGGFSPERLEDDVQAIRLQYNRQGFLSPGVRAETRFLPGQDRVDVVFHIDEGVRTQVDQTIFAGMTLIARAQALDAMNLKPGVLFQEQLVRRDENILKKLIAAKGHPHVQVAGRHTLSADGERASVIYSIDEGPFVRLRSIQYIGNLRTRRAVMDRELPLAPGDPISPRKLSEGQRSIRNLGLFTSVRFRNLGYDAKQPEVDMVVELAERAPYLFEAKAGFESDRRFFANAKIADRNLGGMNRTGWLSGEVSEAGYRIESGLGDPRLMGARIAAHAEGYVERLEGFNQNFGTDQAGVTVNFDATKWKRLTPGFNVSYKYLEQFQRSSSGSPGAILAADQLDPRNVLVATPKFIYDSRDSFLRPRKGIYCQGLVDISKGLDNDLDDFLRYQLDFRYHWTPIDGLTFALVGRWGFVDPYNESGRVPKDQLFYLGGITDVRGFRQNAMLTDTNDDAVGGRESLYGSIEARFGFAPNWEMPVFFDAGRLGGIQDPMVEAEGRLSVGTGLRYITPVGPIGILYGHRLNRESDESRGRFYFSFGYTF